MSQEPLETHITEATYSRTVQNVNQIHEEQSSMGDRWADVLAQKAGSWGFVIAFFSLLLVWIVLNAVILHSRPLDPFPFILLNLMLSCLAAIQAPVILMSQNRSNRKDRIHAEQDYAVNVQSEIMVETLLTKMEHMEREMAALRQAQQSYLNNLKPGNPTPPPAE